MDGTVIETLDEIGVKLVQSSPGGKVKLRTLADSKYKFKLAGYDIAREEFHRIVVFDTETGVVTVKRKLPFELESDCEDKIFYL